MEFEVAIYQLSTEFIRDYPSHRYPELMYKKGRPYSCLLIDLHLDYFICVPYRSSIHHKNAFLFSGTERSRRTKSGLDYSKMVLVEKTEYLDSANVVVDQDEYNETIRNIKKIAGECWIIWKTTSTMQTGVGRSTQESMRGNISIPPCRISTM